MVLKTLYKTLATRTTLIIGSELKYFGRVGSFFSTGFLLEYPSSYVFENLPTWFQFLTKS